MAPRSLQRMTLLATVVASAGAGGATDAELVRRLDELELLLRSQQQVIRSQQDRLANLEGPTVEGDESVRRLQATTASIHGAFDSSHAAYTDAVAIKLMVKHVWLVLCGALVFFMQAGFCMIEVGTCRARGMPMIVVKHLTHICAATVCWWACGWAFAYGGPYTRNGELWKQAVKEDFIGHEEWVGVNTVDDLGGGRFEPSTKIVAWFHQWAVCVVATAIVSGGVGERMTFTGYLLVSMVMTAIVYPIVVEGTWGGGWLFKILDAAFWDQAGAGIVHVCGGTAALMGAVITGARRDRWTAPERFEPSNVGLVAFGTIILWFGWYGLNCGNVRAVTSATPMYPDMSDVSHGFVAAQVAVNTTISASFGGLTVFLIRFAITKKYDILGFCNGIVTGLVTISAGAGSVPMWAAAILGFLGACFYLGTSKLMKLIKVDDPVDRFSIHTVPGIIALIFAPILDRSFNYKSINAWNGFDCIRDAAGQCSQDAWAEVIVSNCILICAVMVWTVMWSVIVFLPLRCLGLTHPPDDSDESLVHMSEDNREFTCLTNPGTESLKARPTLHAI